MTARRLEIVWCPHCAEETLARFYGKCSWCGYGTVPLERKDDPTIIPLSGEEIQPPLFPEAA